MSSKSGTRRTALQTLIAMGLAFSLSAEDTASTRAVILSRKPASAAWKVILHRDGKSAEVPNHYEFRSGDKFAIQVRLNQGSGYLYVLNRTITGSPGRIRATAGRGIHLANSGKPTEVTAEQEEAMLANESASASEYRLVYPATHSRMSREWVTVPSGTLFEMDNNPGLEQLLIIISPRPLTDFAKVLASSGRSAAAPERLRTQQIVRGELARMAANSETEEAAIDTRGILIDNLPNQQGKSVPRRDSSSHTAPIEAAQPYLVELTLIHL